MKPEQLDPRFAALREESRKRKHIKRSRQVTLSNAKRLLKSRNYALCPRCEKRARLRYLEEMCKVCRKKHPEDKLRKEALAGPPPALDRINLTRWLLRVMPSKETKGAKTKFGRDITRHDPMVRAFETAYEAEVERIAKLSPEARIMAATMLWRRVHDAKLLSETIYPYFPIRHLPPNVEDYAQRRYMLLQLNEPGHVPLSLDPAIVKRVVTIKGKTTIILRQMVVVEETEEQAKEMLGETHRERIELEELVEAAKENF